MACGCPSGYIPSPDGLSCIKITSVQPTITPVFYSANTAAQNSVYGQGGANFYDITTRTAPFTAVTGPDRIVDSGNVTLPLVANVSNNLWGNGGLNGRLNSIGLEIAANNEWIGFTYCINVTVAQGYVIGIGADKSCRVKVNGQVYFEVDIATNFSYFKWHMITVILTPGVNIIEMEGKTNSPLGALGAEIYQGATVATLASFSTFAQLSPYIIYSTVNNTGQLYQTGEQSGYVCPSGYALDTCTPGVYSCSLIQRATPSACCFLLTECTTGTTIKTNTDLNVFIGKVISLVGTAGCWSVAADTDPECVGAVPVVVNLSFADCTACLPSCFELVDCLGLQPPIITNTDLSQYDFLTIQIKGCGITCWRVNKATTCVGAIAVTVTKSFVSCLACNPPVVPPAPELLHARKVKPGYNTPGCSPEYTEKINCAYAEQIYSVVKKKRYGISGCCEEDVQKYTIKKWLLDLRSIFDPLACALPCPPLVCPPVVVVPPVPTACPAPDSVTATIDYLQTPCPDATGPVTAEIVFNNPFP